MARTSRISQSNSRNGENMMKRLYIQKTSRPRNAAAAQAQNTAPKPTRQTDTGTRATAKPRSGRFLSAGDKNANTYGKQGKPLSVSRKGKF